MVIPTTTSLASAVTNSNNIAQYSNTIANNNTVVTTSSSTININTDVNSIVETSKKYWPPTNKLSFDTDRLSNSKSSNDKTNALINNAPARVTATTGTNNNNNNNNKPKIYWPPLQLASDIRN